MTRMVTLSDIFTPEEIEKAHTMSRLEVLEQIIRPNMERINTALGQENDPRYLSYLVEYVMRNAGVWSDS